ncbi:MAG: hypothetical protein AB8C02_14675, partial [Halioglobus sp.]
SFYTIARPNDPFDIVIGANLRAQSDILYELSQDEFTRQDKYAIVDFSAGIKGTNHAYTLTAFIKNVFDQNYASLIFAQGPELVQNAYIHRVPKYANRTAGIELTFDF